MLLSVLVAGAAHLAGTVASLEERVQLALIPTMQVLSATWVDADGVTHTVDTPRLTDERLADWIARHNEAVDALKEAFPPAAE